MKTPEITLEARSDTEAVALWTGADGCRFHVWINRPKGVWRAATVKHLAECVTAIRGATHEELAEALAAASDQVAAAAEVLRCS